MIYKQDIDDYLKNQFDNYKYLWSADRESIIQEFVNTNPLTVDIRDKFIYYDNITRNLENKVARHVIGPIEIRMGKSNNMYVIVFDKNLIFF